MNLQETSIQDLLQTTLDLVRDAFYVSVGFGVLGVQKVQDTTNAASERFDDRLAGTRTQLTTITGKLDAQGKVIEDRLNEIETRIDSLLDKFEERLPGTARDAVAQARSQAREARGQVQRLVGRAA